MKKPRHGAEAGAGRSMLSGRVGLDGRTVALSVHRHTTGQGHMPRAVRKAEVRPSAPYPVSQVAVIPEARV